MVICVKIFFLTYIFFCLTESLVFLRRANLEITYETCSIENFIRFCKQYIFKLYNYQIKFLVIY